MRYIITEEWSHWTEDAKPVSHCSSCQNNQVDLISAQQVKWKGQVTEEESNHASTSFRLISTFKVGEE